MGKKSTKYYFYVPLVRFEKPFHHIALAVVPFLALSVVSGLLMTVFPDLPLPGWLFCLVTLVAYSATQFLYLMPFAKKRRSTRRFICTCVLSYGVLVLLAVIFMFATVLLFGESMGNRLFTWFFMPFKLFYFTGILGKLPSTALLGVVMMCTYVFFPLLSVESEEDEEKDKKKNRHHTH